MQHTPTSSTLRNLPTRRFGAAVALCVFVTLTPAGLRAQAAKPEPDTVVFPNGEKLIGHFESFTGGTAKFKSDTLGEITIDLSKVQELHTSEKFAVINKNVKLARGEKDGRPGPLRGGDSGGGRQPAQPGSALAPSRTR